MRKSAIVPVTLPSTPTCPTTGAQLRATGCVPDWGSPGALAAAHESQADTRVREGPEGQWERDLRHLQALVRETGETATLSAPGEHDAITIDFAHSSSVVQSVAQLGKQKGDAPLPENASVTGETVVALRKGLRKGQVREGAM